MMLPSRTKELMDLHGKIKQSEAKYSAIRDLMAGNFLAPSKSYELYTYHTGTSDRTD